MTTLLITFGVFLLVGVLMAVGVIFGRKSIQGSCGGLNQVGVDKVCDCETTCDSHRLYQIAEPGESTKQ
uniref:(Na+)-NQR maturation NqrM n=1 Tax=Thaumasiovibrio occultus TaxID=1891184 RepID=UPI000B35EB94|nr:(Na+)-NQR maturation NqrM [Thaumasiovibrio occultus]